ncbi:ankyrin repeat domain-containing protein 35 isoform X1 [Prionailurus bengalensis]|uniref:ankyrin repeat domain-containing protein 35 isoform X1 n=1 Tax=Prionailurus bengalensis TaxID=37029 RepID=UPI001CA94566|nr:ankyrin repeat domain-containing protein 35 isoform X1 [Prionailurus bengalensis]XP_043431995.1 ankyrin repeat domain-containing protein 35 isoform X1 [Prionailurus bengalensis]
MSLFCCLSSFFPFSTPTPPPLFPPFVALDQVEKWNRRDQKLLEAVQRGDVGRVASLASRKSARPTKLNSSGQSSFHLAASKGLTECLTILLANGADINSKNEDGSTALHLATISCQPQCVKVLLQHGANEDAVDAENRSPLHWAASSGCASSVLLLCDHEAFLNVPDNDGRTPLMIASLGGHAAICSQLLQRGAQVNVTDKDAKSALILACEKGSAEVAELLLSHGADAGAVDNEGHDALHYAVRSEDRELWRLLRQALLRQGRQGGQGLAQHLDLTSQASPSESQVGSPPQSPWRAEPEEEEEEDPCPDEWRRKYEEEQRKVSQLEQELVQKTEESEARAAACLGLENGIREQVQELGLLLSPQPGTPGGQGSSLRPGGDGMEQGCPLDLLAERIQELKKQQQAAAAAAAKRALASKKAEDSVSGEVPYEAPGGAQPEEQGPPQSPRSETIGKATGQQLTTSGGQALGPDHTDKPRADQKEGPGAPGAEPAGTAAAPVGPGDVNQLLLQLREELAAVWREKDAARGALSRPVLEGALGTPRAEAAAAAWEKMEARLEQVLVRLDRAKAGLPVSPDAAARPREGALHAGPETTSEENEGGRPGAPGARGEPLGAPARGQVPGGGPAKGRLEKEVAALRLSNSNLLGELGQLGQERQRLQGEPQSLSQRLQRDFVPKPEAQDQLRQLRRSVGLLTDELAAEKEATEQLRQRLASQSSGLRGLWDDLPPDVVGRGVAGRTAAEPLEELRACIRALADGHREAQDSLARLEQENRRLRGSPGPRGEPPGTFSQGPVSPQVAALEQDLGKLEEELRAVQATMSGKSQEIGTLKKLLYQATEEVAELRAREAASLRQHEKTRGSLVAQAQAWGQELKALLEKYNTACREMGRLREAAAEERRRSGDLAARAAEQERQAAELRGRSQQFEKTAEVLRDKVEHLIGACRDKEAKIKELLKKLEQLSEEVLAVRGENARLALQLQDSQKNHEEIISAYRKHLLNAAQGYMEQDVYNILLRILSIQEE